MATAFDIINQGFANDTAANQQASQMKLRVALENFQMAKEQEAAIAAEGRAYTRQMDLISINAQKAEEAQRRLFTQQMELQLARDKALDERQGSKEEAALKKAEEEARRKSKAAAGGVRAIKSQIEQMQANLQGEFSTLDQRSRTPDIAAAATQQLLAAGRIKPDQAVVLASHIKKGDLDAYEQALANFAKSNETSMWRGSAKEGSEIASTLSAYENLKQQRKSQLALQADNNFQLAKASIDDLYRQAAEAERYILPEDRDVLTPKVEGKTEVAPEKPQTEADRFKATLAKPQTSVAPVAPVIPVASSMDQYLATVASNNAMTQGMTGPLEEQLPNGTWQPTALGVKAAAQKAEWQQAAAQKDALRQKASANWYNPFAPFLGQQ